VQTKSSRRSIRRLRGGGRRLLTAFSLPVLLALPFGFAVPQTAYGAQAHAAQRVGDDPQPSPQRSLPTNLPATLAHPGDVLVAFRAPVGVTATRVASAGTSGAYHANAATAQTDVATLNQTLSGLGTTRITHLFAGIDATALNAARARAMAKTGRYITDFTQVYQVSFDPKINDGKAANELARSPLVASASPDFILPKPVVQKDGLPAATTPREAPGAHAAVTRSRAAALAIPNYSYVTDGQSYHDAASNDLTGAVAMLRNKFGRAPGRGETILNISLGRIADDSTVIENGQRYLEQRGYPRIATYTSNANVSTPDEAGNLGCLDPLGTNVTDPNQQYDLTEPMLDFSVMAPPPNGNPRVRNPQAPGQLGNILGAAYGANFRLVNPNRNSTADFVAAFLCGGDTRRFTPTIMTASIGDGAFPGFSGDYFFTEEALIHDAVQLEVQGNDIFVSISAGDGQTDTRSAAYPNGIIGSTEVTTDISKPVDINDPNGFTNPNYSYLLTFEPQFVLDSGASDAGGDTLNDIFNNSPYNIVIDSRTRHTQHTTETRWTGQQNFNSGYGSRTNLSAPADDVLFLAQPSFLTGKATNPNPIDDEPGLIGGTSASAPEIAAAAAVVRQTARLLGHPLSATDIRDELIATARPHQFPAFDLDKAYVGPELDLTRAVADLFSKYSSGTTTPSFVRMTVAQRKAVPYSTGFGRGFYTDTPQDPKAMTATIDLSQGLTPQSSFANETLGPTGDNLNAPITFGADGKFLPAGATFSWSLGYNGTTTAVPTGDYDASLPYLRLLPSEIFTIVGQPVTAPTDRVVTVTVTSGAATSGAATTAMAVTFKGQSDATYTHAVPPSFKPVFQPSSPADGVTFSYDLTGLRASSTPASGAYPTVTGGELIISDIDRALPRAFPDSNLDAHGCKVTLAGLTGSITLTPADPRVAACLGHGAGTYGIALRGTTSSGEIVGSTSAWTPLRYAPALEQHPDTPKVQAQVSGLADVYGHGSSAPVFYDLPDLGIGGSSLFTVTYTTTAVQGATGSMIEISAPTADFFKGAFLTGNVPDANKFTNPYGDRLDMGDNYGQSGSVYHTSVLPSTSGSITLDAAALGLTPQAGRCDSAYQVRVFATDASGHIVGVASNPSIIDPGYYNVNNNSAICAAPANGGGGGGAPTPELGSGELLATGLVPLLAALVYRNRRRARRGAPTQDEEEDNLV